MSDALTDIARDERRAERYGEFLDALVAHLAAPNAGRLLELKRRAKAVDEVHRGYWGGQTNLVAWMSDGAVKRLLACDEKEWEMLLRSMFSYDRRTFIALKKLSPFKDMFMFAFGKTENAFEIVDFLKTLNNEVFDFRGKTIFISRGGKMKIISHES